MKSKVTVRSSADVSIVAGERVKLARARVGPSVSPAPVCSKLFGCPSVASCAVVRRTWLPAWSTSWTSTVQVPSAEYRGRVIAAL